MQVVFIGRSRRPVPAGRLFIQARSCHFRRAVVSNQTLRKPTRTGSLAGSIVEHLALGKDGELVR
jgi:hypothetical protein